MTASLLDPGWWDSGSGEYKNKPNQIQRLAKYNGRDINKDSDKDQGKGKDKDNENDSDKDKNKDKDNEWRDNLSTAWMSFLDTRDKDKDKIKTR